MSVPTANRSTDPQLTKHTLVELTDENGGRPGMRLRKRRRFGGTPLDLEAAKHRNIPPIASSLPQKIKDRDLVVMASHGRRAAARVLSRRCSLPTLIVHITALSPLTRFGSE
jgi:hypothetical protein